MVTIHPYVPEQDEAAVFALWQAALGQQWPLAAADFRLVTTGSPHYQAGDHLVARAGDRIVGFAATQMQRGQPDTASFMAICVDPARQRQGIGTALHTAALDHLRALGASDVQLAGGGMRFWPGVPSNLPAAIAFFQALGWSFTEVCHDLVQDLRDYRSPPDLAADIVIETVSPAQVEQLLDFERREFPSWLDGFEPLANIGDYDDLLVARGSQCGDIIGSLTLFTHHSHPSRADVIWKELIGEPAGAFGCVGVAATEQNRGIGTALVARASEILKDRGVVFVYVSWVDRVQFYGRLGYAKWREYQMSWRDL